MGAVLAAATSSAKVSALQVGQEPAGDISAPHRGQLTGAPLIVAPGTL